MTLPTRTGGTWTAALLAGPGPYPNDLNSTAGAAGFVDGPAAAARFSSPCDVVLSPDQSRLWVADYANHAIRAVDTTTGATTTIRTGAPNQSTDLCLPMCMQLGQQSGYLYVTCRNPSLAGNAQGFMVRINPTTGALVDVLIPPSTNTATIVGFDLNASETKCYLNCVGYNTVFGDVDGQVMIQTIGGALVAGFSFSDNADGQAVVYIDALDQFYVWNNAFYNFGSIPNCQGINVMRGSDGALLASPEINARTGYNYLKSNGRVCKIQDASGNWHLISYYGHIGGGNASDSAVDVWLSPNGQDIDPAGGPWTWADTPTASYCEFWNPGNRDTSNDQLTPFGLAMKPDASLMYFADNPGYTASDGTFTDNLQAWQTNSIYSLRAPAIGWAIGMVR